MTESINRDLATSLSAAVINDTLTSTGQVSGGITVVSDYESLPSGSVGDRAFVTSNDAYYIHSGDGWFQIALINTTPVINSLVDANGDSATSPFVLSIEGATSIITLTATDPEGTPIIYSAVTDSDFSGMATVSQSGQDFTITPLSQETATTASGTITFRASDGVNIATQLTTFTLTYATPIENSNKTTLLVKASGTNGTNTIFSDGSADNNTITANGGVINQAVTPYHPGGYSTYFDGTGDYLTIESPYSDVGSSADFTAEAWIYIDAGYTQTNPLVFSSNSGGLNFGLMNSSGYKLNVGHSYVGNVVTGTTTINLATWYHIALVRNSGTLKTYINGVEESSLANTSNFVGTTNYNGSIPALGASYNWKGYLKDVRFVKGTAVYTSAFTPPTEPLTAIANTSLLTCHLPYIADGSTNGHTITVSGNTSTARFSPYDYLNEYSSSDYGTSVYFDGTNDYITVTDSTNFDFGTGDFTMEGWYYAKDVSGDRYILSFSTSSGNGHFGVNHYNGGWRVGLFNGSLITGTTGIQTNIWHHFAWVRASGVMKFYIDGAQVGSDVSYSSALDCSGTFKIGTYAVDAAYGEYLGYLSDIRIVKGTAVYTSAFTPPTEPLTAIANTKFLLQSTPNVYDASGTSLLTLSGGTKSSTTQTKFATSSSFYLDGSDDLIYFLPTIPFGADDFTIEFWWYKTTTGRQALFFGTAGQMNSIGMTYGWPSGNTVQMYAGSNGFTWDMIEVDGNPPDTGQGTVELSHNAWNHIAMTRENSTFRLFVNGTLDLTITGKTGAIAHYGNGTRYGMIGQWYQAGMPQGQAQGYFQNFRITNGLARYTSSFTPSTEEFEG